VSVSRFKKKNLIFVDPEVNVDDTYCRDVLLTEEILPVMCVISGEFFYLPPKQYSGIPSTRDNQPSRMHGRHPLSFHQTCGSHSSPELNAVELTTEFGEKMQQRFYYTKVHDVFKVKQRMPCLTRGPYAKK